MKPGASLWTGLSQNLARWLFALSDKICIFQLSVKTFVFCVMRKQSPNSCHLSSKEGHGSEEQDDSH